MKREWNYFFEEIFFSFQRFNLFTLSSQVHKFKFTSGRKDLLRGCGPWARGRETFLEENFKALWKKADPGYIGHVCLWRPLLPWKNNLQWGQKYLRSFLGVLQNYHQMEIFSLDDLGILRTTARNPAGVM